MSRKHGKPHRTLQSIGVCEIDAAGRHRKDMGDIAALARSINEVGLLQPIVITRDKKLIAGERRLRALVSLDWPTIPAYVVENLEDAAALLQAQRDENTCRKPFTLWEAVAIGTALEALEREKARERQANAGPSNGKGKKATASGKLPEALNGRTRDRVAEALGMSGRTFEKAKQVVEAAKRAPEAFGDLLKTMDESGKVDQPFQEMKRREKLQELERKAAAAPPVNPDTTRIIEGDCLDVLRRLETAGERFRLIFADPPYNLGVDYGKGADADRLPDEEYMAWVTQWMELCRRCLVPDGSFWVLINDEYAAEYGVALKRSGFTIRNWIKWYETFGVNCEDKFNRTSRHLFYCVNDPKAFVFHKEAVTRPSDRQSKYCDKRANPEGKRLDDVWTDIPRLVGTATERVPGFPTQLPIELLERVILCATDPGDLVLDPFSGSATTGSAALRHGRRYVGIEKKPTFAEQSKVRLQGECHGQR